MLQWFNKQAHTNSSVKEKVENSFHSLVSDPGLTDNDYEFLFNQLLDGVAHGWHLGKIIKFFNNLKPRTHPVHWLGWLEKFEKKIVYVADPSQKRVGAIMMRFGEITRSDEELEQLSVIFHRIGKNLFLGDTAELIWEYEGIDRVVEVNNESFAESDDQSDLGLALDEEELVSKTPEREFADLAASIGDDSTSNGDRESISQEVETAISDLESNVQTTEEFIVSEKELLQEELAEKSSQNPDLVLDGASIEDNDEIASLETLTEQLTVLQENNPELEIIDRHLAPESSVSEESNQNFDLASEPELEHSEERSLFAEDDEAIVSLETLTEQLTVLQENNPELELIDRVTSPESNVSERSNQNFDLAFEPESEHSDNDKAIASLETLTKQLTVLQDDDDESHSTLEDRDSEITLVAPETLQTDSSTPLSVASFLEAAKALDPQPKKKVTPITWEEFIAVLEQDETLAIQVARHLGIASTDPNEILQVIVDRFTQKKKAQISPETVELVQSWFKLGLKQASTEDFQGAIASWDKALKLNSNLSEAWHNRGSALGRLKQYEEAIKSFNRAINIAPKRYQAWNDRAHALYQIKKWTQAVESWDKAISLMPDNYQFWYNRGCALEQLQRFDESISSYEKTLEIKPDFKPAKSRYINLVTENSSSASN